MAIADRRAVDRSRAIGRAARRHVDLDAALPLLVMGYAARGAMPVLRKRLVATGSATRPIFGAVLVLFAVLVLTGLDKRIEAVATAALPDSWVELIVRF